MAGGPAVPRPPAGAPPRVGAPADTGRQEADGPPAELEPVRWTPRRGPVVSTGSAARFAERARMRRRITRDRLLAWTGVVGVAGGVCWLLLASPVLAVDAAEIEVRIEGDQAVVDAASVHAVLDAAAGVPLPRLDTVGLRRQVLDVPGVRAASVSRRWPHGLLVTVVARDPVAAVPTVAGIAHPYADGVQVGRSDAPPQGLPVVGVPLGETRALTAVLLVLQQLPPELAADVVSASAPNQDAVALDLADGARVEWGSADQSALKAAVLTTLRAAPTSAGVRVFHVPAPTLPITRS